MNMQPIGNDSQLAAPLLVLVQVQFLVLHLSDPTLLLFGMETFLTGLSPCGAFVLLFLFISYKPHFTSATKKRK